MMDDFIATQALVMTLGASAYENNAEFKASQDPRFIKLITSGVDARDIKVLVESWERGWETAWLKSKGLLGQPAEI